MDAAILKRLRGDAGVQAAAGVYNGKAAIDHQERKSDDESAFPAAIQTVVAAPKRYNQDGAVGAQTWRMRWECFSLDSDDGAVALGDAIVAALEPAGVHDGVRFGAGLNALGRSGGVQEVNNLRIFRRIYDMDISATL